MKPVQREVLVVGLAAVAGALDSWSYFGLSHIFIANMTGNTVMAGFSLAAGNVARAVGSAGALLSYAAGVYGGTRWSEPIRAAVGQSEAHGLNPSEEPWPPRLTTILTAQLALVLLAASLTWGCRPATDGLAAHLLVSLGAFAIGLQSAAMLAMKLPGVVTTYITGTWTTMVAALGQRSTAGEDGTGRWSNVALQAWVLVTYLAAAAFSGFLFRLAGASCLGFLPAAMLMVVLVLASAWERSVANTNR